MHHLSALDALFLHLETPDMPMHVGSLSLLEKPKDCRGSFYPRIRQHIESRMHLAPLFSRRLAFMPFDLANPIWLNDTHVDLDDHMERVVLPKPGTQAQLEAMVAQRVIGDCCLTNRRNRKWKSRSESWIRGSSSNKVYEGNDPTTRSGGLILQTVVQHPAATSGNWKQ